MTLTAKALSQRMSSPKKPQPPVDTLAVERDRLKGVMFAGGSTCKCCGLHVQAYNESITATMAAVIKMMFLEYRRGNVWVDVNALIADFSRDVSPKFTKKVGGRWAKLRHWGLITPKDGNITGGIWSLTPAGVDFCNGGSVPARLVMFAGRVVSVSGTKTVTWADVAGKKFDLKFTLAATGS